MSKFIPQKGSKFQYTKNKLMKKYKGVQVSETQETKRDMEAIKAEFTNVCARAGNAAYQIKLLQSEISQLESRMAELNQEAATLPKEEVTNEVPSEG